MTNILKYGMKTLIRGLLNPSFVRACILLEKIDLDGEEY
jgi:hypothetical protein